MSLFWAWFWLIASVAWLVIVAVSLRDAFRSDLARMGWKAWIGPLLLALYVGYVVFFTWKQTSS